MTDGLNPWMPLQAEDLLDNLIVRCYINNA
jgi:hypothetical protein